MQVSNILLGIFGVWLIALSIFAFWIFTFLRSLTAQIEKGNLLGVLKAILEKEKSNTSSIKVIEKEIINLNEDSFSHIQKIGLVRFNPFKEMGGDHSFSLAILDKDDNGFVLTGLHTRERTRVYAKEIRRGRAQIELSNEEKKAMVSAQKK